MTGLRLLTLLSAIMLIAFGSCSVGRAEQALPLELAEILPMSAEDLLKMADQQSDFITPAQQTQDYAETENDHALAEVNQEMQSEAQVEAEVEQEASAESEQTPALPAAPAATPAPAPAATPAAPGAPAAATPAAPGAEDDQKPVLPTEDATRRLKRHRHEIRRLEDKIEDQTSEFQQHTADPVPTLRGKPISSGANYWEGKIDQLKSSAASVVGDSASDLTQTDARCVMCQFVVQQAMGILSGKPLTSGGATAGGKRAAAAADASAAPAATDAAATTAAFLEFEEQMDELEELEDSEDPFEFLELDASLGVFAEAGLDAVLAAEMESTVALNSAMENFLSASEAAMEHTATEALRSHYRRPYMGPNLRNVNAVSYPRQLNDFGFEENQRNRQADVLAFRPRQARFARGDIAAAQAKWDETHATYQKLYNGVYHAFESLCTKRMPLAYVGYCQEMMRDYRYIAQGIQYGDRAQSICMNGNWCDRKSYIRHAVHAYFVRAPGDN